MSRTNSALLAVVCAVGCCKSSATPPKTAPDPAEVLFTDIGKPPVFAAAANHAGAPSAAAGAAGATPAGGTGPGGAASSAGTPSKPSETHPLATCDATRVTSRLSVDAEKAMKLLPKIIGGENSDIQGLVALTHDGTQKRQFCGGSLIGDDWVLTAAHCRVMAGDKAIVGVLDLTKTGSGNVVDVDFALEHARFDHTTFVNDIALVKLKKPFPNAPRVRIGAQDPTEGMLTVAGWGITEHGTRSSVLLDVAVPLVSNMVCKGPYPNLTNDMLCAGATAKDSCQGDSGGPIGIADGSTLTQLGIVSFGKDCGVEKNPGVYTRVSAFKPWIDACMKSP